MNERHPHDTEDRLRDALSAFTEQVEPTGDAWAKIRAGVETRERKRRVTFWSSVAVAGAAAAVAAVVAYASVGRGPDTEVTPVGPGDLESGFVAVTEDGEIHGYEPDGTDVGVIAETDWSAGANVTGPIATVAADGETVYFSRPAPADGCPRAEALGSEIVSVPIAGGEPEVVVPVGVAPAASPDGGELAYLTTRSGEQCDGGEPLVLMLRDLSDGSERRVPIDLVDDVDFGPNRPIPTEDPLAWSPEGSEIALNMLFGDQEGWGVVVVDVASGAARRVYEWGEGVGGPAVAFADEGSVLTDVSSSGGPPDFRSTGICRFTTEVRESVPVGEECLRIASFPGSGAIGTMSTLPRGSADEYGVLVSIPDSDAGAAAPTPTSVWVFDGYETRKLADGVVSAVWLPGTTWEDVVEDPDAELVARVPLDVGYLSDLGFPGSMAVDESGVWVTATLDEMGERPGVVHVDDETNEVDRRIELPFAVSIETFGDDLWFAGSAGYGRIGADDQEPETFDELLTGAEMVAGDSALWLTGFVDDRIARIDPDTGERTDYPLPGSPQDVLTLDEEVWIRLEGRNSLARVDQATGELVDEVEHPVLADPNVWSFAAAGETIWTVDADGDLVPLVGEHAGEEPLPTGLPGGALVPTDDGLAVTYGDDRNLRLFDGDGTPTTDVLVLPVEPRNGADGPYGGLVVDGATAWWQNARGPSLLRIELG